MKRNIIKIAASTMVLGLTLTNCSGIGSSLASVSSKAPKGGSATLAKRADKALAKGQVDKAISLYERVVEVSPNNGTYRAELGRAYVAAGRFKSAERSFLDAMELGQNDARTILNLSLAKLAMNKDREATRIIRNNRQYIPASDYGLALALAGETKAGVDVLVDAIRKNNVTPQTRQNLAFAYALDGRWREAKLMAVQDIDPASVDSRIIEWARIGRPGAYQERVASLLGVQPALSDPGQPVRLALNPQSAPIDSVDTSPVQTASIGSQLPAIGPAPRPVSVAPASAAAEPVTKVAAAPIIKVPVVKTPVVKAPAAKTPKAPVRIASKAKKPAPIKVASAKSSDKFIVEKARAAKFQKAAFAKPIVKKPVSRAIPRTKSNGTYLVQLGAFSSPDSTRRAWSALTKQYPTLSSFKNASSRVNSNGKTLYRLAAMGFGNESSAAAICGRIKTKGGNCIVRKVSGVNSKKIATKVPQKLASR